MRLPGSRAVWLGALLPLVVVGVLGARMLLTRDAPLTGTNSVGLGAVIAKAQPGEETCVRDLVVPAGTDGVELWAGTPGGGVGEVRGRLTGRGAPPVAVPVQRFGRPDGGGGFVRLRLGATVTAEMDDAVLCLRQRRVALDLGGASVMRLPGRPVSTVGGERLDATGVDVLVRFVGTAVADDRLLTRLDEALDRATRFKPYGGWLVGLALLGLLGAGVGTVVVLATAQRRSARELAVRAWALALVGSSSFALLLPVFGGPDESEHVAHAVHVAAAGERASAARTDAPPYSSSQLRLMEALHHNSTILNPTSRPRWEADFERQWKRVRDDASDEDGGGYTESASGHSPLYYGLVSLPYRAFDGVSGGAVLTMRLWNALLASLVAGIAVLVASLLVPRARQVWWLAGVLVATQPVAASVGGSVNNDTLVNLFAAVAIGLLVHGWVRGPRWSTMVALGVATAALPLAKITGFAQWPVLAVGWLVVLARHRDVRLLAAPAAAAVLAGGWLLAGGTLNNRHPAEPVVQDAPVAAGLTVLDKVSYAVETVVPYVGLTSDAWPGSRWGLDDIYVERGYGLIGWPTAGPTEGVLDLVGLALLVGWALAVVAAWRHRRGWRTWLVPAGMLVASIAATVLLVGYAYASFRAPPVLGEQGRYVFPALVPLAVLLACGALALRGRWRELYLGAASAASCGLLVVVWLSVLRGLYV